MNDSPISLTGITRRFAEITAVDDLDLDVQRGETVALLGPNGAGKTTALEMILGLRRPDAGEVHLLGGAPTDAIAQGRVGAMLQEGALPPGATVGELVGLVRGLYPDPPPLDEALRVSDLVDVSGRRVERLSGGQQQRARLALALAGGPELLLLDEPTAAMDTAARRTFWSSLTEHVSSGRTVLFATHRLEEADEVADRVLVLARGRLVADGRPADVKVAATGRGAVSFRADGIPLDVLERLPAVEEVEVAGGRVTLRTSDPDRTVHVLLGRGPRVAELEVIAPRLEDAFLALTGEEDPR